MLTFAINLKIMREAINKLKKDLAEVFDDDLKTVKWHNIVDWLIISLILVSTAEIFLSTFDLDPKLRHILYWVDIGILIFFTIEVTLRIWVAPLLNPKYSGLMGRIRYCLTFHGFLDIISTYPFYFQWLLPFPVTWMRAFRMARTVRLFRMSRYMSSWNLLENTIRSKKRELFVSMQFLVVVTIILSLSLYFCEHEAQPENYNNGFATVLWAFGQYIGDPGGFAEAPPVTTFGKIIACIVGLLGIAIVAVPAGIIGTGFTEAIEHEQGDKKLVSNQNKLLRIFRRTIDYPTGFYAVSFFKSFADIQAKTGMTENDIIETVDQTPGFRVINLASTVPSGNNTADRFAVEHFHINRSYGIYVDRGSRVTIISSASHEEPAGGIFSFYIAYIGGFNFISREVADRIVHRSLHDYNNYESLFESDKEFLDDLKYLTNRPDGWSFDILPCSGQHSPEYPTQIHFGIGNNRGNESFDGENLLIKDVKTYKNFYDTFTEVMKKDFNIECDNGRYYSTSSQSIWHRQLDMPNDCNSVVVRMAFSAILWNDERLNISKTFADIINQSVLGQSVAPPDAMNEADFGFKGYDVSSTEGFSEGSKNS